MIAREDARMLIFDTLQLAGVEFSQISSMTEYVLEMLEVVGKVGNDTESPLFLTRKQASAYLLEHWNLNKTFRVLSAAAKSGTGPFFYVNKKTPLYSRFYLDQWAKEQIVGPTILDPGYTEPTPLNS